MERPGLISIEESGEMPGSDLERRLERFRMRLVAEGRTRSLTVLDRAIREATAADRANAHSAARVKAT